MWAIYKKETGAFFRSMTGYLYIAFLLVVSGVYFTAFNLQGGMAEFGYVLGNTTVVLLIVIPVLTMRTLGEEQRQRTDQLLFTAPVGIPGIVLGLGYVLTFRGSAIYGTFALLIMVNITHFFASPYLLAYNSLSNFNEKMEDVSVTLGIGKWRMLMDVYLPSTKATIIEMFSYMFVNAMVTISAVSFLANFRNMPLALMIPQFDSQSLIEATAFISVLILFVNGMMKLVVYGMKRKLTNQ